MTTRTFSGRRAASALSGSPLLLWLLFQTVLQPVHARSREISQLRDEAGPVTAADVVQVSPDRYLILASVFLDDTLKSYSRIRQVTSAGQTIWEKRFGESDTDSAIHAATAMPDHGAIVLGTMQDHGQRYASVFAIEE